MVSSKAIPISTVECVNRFAGDPDAAFLWRDYTGDKAEQRAFAAAAWPFDEDPLSALNLQTLDI